MRKQSFLTIALILLLITPLTAGGEDLVEQSGNGTINWSKAVVVSKGIGAPPAKSYGKPQARPLALRAAKLDAMRNILEIVQGIRIDSTTVVRTYAAESDLILAKVQGMVQNATVAKQEYMSDGTVEVTLEMDMRGGFSQLVLPTEIKQVETVTAVKSEAKPSRASATEVYTGLVVDARGLRARPAMAPKILDEQGKEVYGAAYVSREYAVQQGMSGYAKSPKSALENPRVTDNPLQIKGIKTAGPGNADIVISNADAARLHGASENLSFLKKCRVIILVD